MLALQEKVAEAAQSHLENFIMLAVATVAVVAGVFRDVIASWWKGVSTRVVSGLRSALKMSLLGKGLQILPKFFWYAQLTLLT